MILLMYSLKDSKVSSYSAPMCIASEIDALRELNSATSNTNTKTAHYPQDFDLFKVGEFDTDSGKMKVHDPVFVVNAFSNKMKFEQLYRDVKAAQENLKKGGQNDKRSA